MIVGSVDDGKSTLIGRLLYELKAVYDDQLAAVRKATTMEGVPIDFSLFTDGLEAEREQGITIDVAYRYFTTEKRKFIVADTPGHVQYTRNMVTGASTADVGVILIDARLGVLEQSRRHAYIASLLGIPHLLVAVNKMDLVDYGAGALRGDPRRVPRVLRGLTFKDVTFVPGQRAARRERGAARRAHALVQGPDRARLPRERADRRGPQPQGLPLSRCSTCCARTSTTAASRRRSPAAW